MSKVTRRITDPRALSLITKFRAKIKTMPDEQRLCPIHDEAVNVHEDNFSSPVNAPNFETVFTGCCDKAIDEEMKYITKTAEQ